METNTTSANQRELSLEEITAISGGSDSDNIEEIIVTGTRSTIQIFDSSLSASGAETGGGTFIGSISETADGDVSLNGEIIPDPRSGTEPTPTNTTPTNTSTSIPTSISLSDGVSLGIDGSGLLNGEIIFTMTFSDPLK